MADGSSNTDWLKQYNVIGKIGKVGLGHIFLATSNSPADRGKFIALKRFRPFSTDEYGVHPSIIQEIKLLRDMSHENVVKLLDVHTNLSNMTMCLALEYAEYDLIGILWYHRFNDKHAISRYTVKSLLWQMLNGLNYLHSNWIMHQDIKPSNILVMGEGDDEGVVKISGFGLSRIFEDPLNPLYLDGVVVNSWYLAPELLLGANYYTTAIDIWAIGCIFAELLTSFPLFPGLRVRTTPDAFQLDQLYRIFMVLGHPTTEMWPLLEYVPHWQSNVQDVRNIQFHGSMLHGVVNLSQNDPAYDLLSKMLKYDPQERIIAADALEHEYFRIEPVPGRNSIVPPSPEEKVVYPTRKPVLNTNINGP